MGSRARVLVLGLVLAGPILPPLAAAASKSPFALATYHGKTSLGGTVDMRLWKGHCDRYRQSSVQLSGYCFVITGLTPVPRSHCSNPDAQQQASQITLEPYGTNPEKIHLAASGRYHDAVETFGSGPKPVSVVTLDFTAKGHQVSGKVTVHAGGDGEGHYACGLAAMTFTAHG